jgi:ribosomal protein S19E (S16A)
MERKERGTGQDKTAYGALDFIKENGLVQEVDRKPLLSSKGERVLRELQESLGQSNPGSSGVS